VGVVDAVVTFTSGAAARRRQVRLSEAMLAAQVAAGYHQADVFIAFLEVEKDDLMVDPAPH